MGKRVIIIGAGISGLAAAKVLLKNNYEVTVLEASSEQIGGRASLRQEIGGTVAELGAQCMYGEVGCLAEFCRKLNFADKSINFGDIGPDDDAYLMNRFISPDDGILDSSYNEGLEILVQNVKDRVATDSQMDAMKLQEVFDEVYLKLSSSFDLSSESERLHTKAFQWLTRFFKLLEPPPVWFRGQDTKLPISDVRNTIMWKEPMGSTALVKLIADIPDDNGIGPGVASVLPWIKLGKSVVKIKYGLDGCSNSVEILCSDDTRYTADSVICTLPLGVLKVSNCTLFEPQLPVEKLEAIHNMELSTFNIFAMNFERSDWWPKDFTGLNPIFTNYEGENKNSLLEEDEHGIPNWCKAIFALYRIDDGKSDNLVLFGFLSGASAEVMEVFKQDYIKKSFQRLLSHLLKKLELGSVPTPTNFVMSKWLSNPLSVGSFTTSSRSFEQTKLLCDALRKPIGESSTIYFAGEATSPQYFATLHGAYYSGIDAAEALIRENS